MADEEFISFGELKVEGATPRVIPFKDPEYEGRIHKVWRILPDDRITIFLLESAWREMTREAAEHPDAEVGGVLLGGYHVDEGREFVVVDGTIAAHHVLSSSYSLTFTHETWGAISREAQSKAQGRRQVGWYHSHPKSGAFLSEPDQFVHQNFFSLPWQVAYVVSVRDGAVAAFQWRENVLVGRCGYYVLTERAAQAAPELAGADGIVRIG